MHATGTRSNLNPNPNPNPNHRPNPKQVMIHVRSSEASLATLPGLAISIRHKELGVLVAPPLALSGERADLLGDDALLVGQTYVCEVSQPQPYP